MLFWGGLVMVRWCFDPGFLVVLLGLDLVRIVWLAAPQLERGNGRGRL